MHVKSIRAAFIALACAAAFPVQAQQSSTTTTTSTQTTWPYQKEFWSYFGATVGQSDFKCCSDKGTGYRVFGGGRVNNIFGTELSYVDLGKTDNAGFSTEARGANLSLVLNAPLGGDMFGVFAKAGGIYSWTETTAITGANTKDNGFDLSYGVGATFNFTRNVGVRVDWDRYRLHTVGGKSDADLLSAGVQFRF